MIINNSEFRSRRFDPTISIDHLARPGDGRRSASTGRRPTAIRQTSRRCSSEANDTVQEANDTVTGGPHDSPHEQALSDDQALALALDAHEQLQALSQPVSSAQHQHRPKQIPKQMYQLNGPQKRYHQLANLNRTRKFRQQHRQLFHTRSRPS